MLLTNKNAVISGAGGAIGGAFARERAKVFLAGRTLATLDAVAMDISAAGGVAETARVDALDEQAVEKHAAAVAEKAGGNDPSFNAISIRDVQGTPLVDMWLEDFTLPIMNRHKGAPAGPMSFGPLRGLYLWTPTAPSVRRHSAN